MRPDISTERSINKLVENSFYIKDELNDLLFGVKELSGKLDTIIAFEQAALSSKPKEGGSNN